MRREAGPEARSAIRPSNSSVARGEPGANLRVAIVQALELLGDGDEVAAVEVLLSALEDGPGPSERRFTCDECGVAFEFPGLREAHQFSSGHELGAEPETEIAA
jgi:hypothetical protein